MKRRSQDQQKKRKIPFVYFHETWKPSDDAKIWQLRDEGTLISIDDYIYQVGRQKRYFCPTCGYSCYRNPKEKKFDRSGDDAHFSHHPNPNAPFCPLRTYKPEGKCYSSQEELDRAREKGSLTVIRQWRQRPSVDELLGREYSEYQGTVENEEGLPANRPINRHTGQARFFPKKISSLQFIAQHIDEFLGQDIQLPDFLTPEPFLDIFIHASEIQNPVRLLSGLYWGRVERVAYLGDYICINFGYDTHCIIFGIKKEDAIDRHWEISNLKGKYVVVAGRLERASRLQKMEETNPLPRKCWRVVADNWGAAGVISEDLVHILPHPTNFNWVEPPELEKLKKGVKKIDSISPSLLKNQSKPKNHTLQKESQISKDKYSGSEADKARKELQQPIQINQSNPKLQVQELNQLSNIENEFESKANPDEKSMEPLIIPASETHESGFYSLDSQSIPSENEPINLLFSQQQTNLKRSEPVEQQDRQSTNKRSSRFRYPSWLDNLINFRFSSLKNWMNRMWQRLRGR